MIEIVSQGQLREQRTLSDQLNELASILEQDFDVTVTYVTMSSARTKVLLSKQGYRSLILRVTGKFKFVVEDRDTEVIKCSSSDISEVQDYLESYFV